ncbi:polyketide synthase dehydratase domain-containing protein, partial [Streptomyces asiaticus]
GASVDWSVFYAERPGERIDLPTYAFQHQHYWLEARTDVGDVAAAGLDAAEHPLLGAAVTLAGSDGVVLTGLLSPATQRWMADHRVGETIVLPGAAFVELALRAGDQVGCGVLAELTVETPLPLPPRGGVRVQVAVSAPDGTGRRPISVYSRPDGEAPWTLHASGALAATGARPPGDADLAAWPPPDVEPLDVSAVYPALADAGLVYGPAFQGLTAAWQSGGDLYAEVELPPDERDQAGRLGLHPALLDAAFHAAAFAGVFGDEAALPHAWTDVALHAVGAASLRVRIRAGEAGGVSLYAADPAGQPVLTARSVTAAPAHLDRRADPAGPAPHECLYRLDWQPAPDTSPAEVLTAVEWDALAEDSAPDVVVFRVGGEDARTLVGRVLGVLQSWLVGDRFVGSRLVVLT